MDMDTLKDTEPTQDKRIKSSDDEDDGELPAQTKPNEITERNGTGQSIEDKSKASTDEGDTEPLAQNQPNESTEKGDAEDTPATTENKLNATMDKEYAEPLAQNRPNESTERNDAGPSTENNPPGGSRSSTPEPEDFKGQERVTNFILSVNDELSERMRRYTNEGGDAGPSTSNKSKGIGKDLTFLCEIFQSMITVAEREVEMYENKIRAGSSTERQPKSHRDGAGPSTGNSLPKSSDTDTSKDEEEFISKCKKQAIELHNEMEALSGVGDDETSPTMPMMNEKMQEYDEEEIEKKKEK